MAKRSKLKAIESKVEKAIEFGGHGRSLGGSLGGSALAALGTGVGAITGLIIGDSEIVLPLDMVCIPAYQAYMIEGTPSMQIYLRAGETIAPTGGNVQDVQEAIDEMIDEVPSAVGPSNLKKPASKYQQAYKKNFYKVAKKYRTKSGRFRSGGFKKTVKEAHKLTKAGMGKKKK